ncbi:hypothetical protein AB0H17_22300 [Streptomyces olivoreticuli]
MRVVGQQRLGAAIAVAVAAVGLTAMAPTAHAQPRGEDGATAISTSIDANSQLRWGPYLSSARAGVTASRASFWVECYTRGSDYDDGKHHTDVWYHGNVIDGNHAYYDVYSWGGNVNTPHDPPSGLGHC